jgi:hypothetical protein
MRMNREKFFTQRLSILRPWKVEKLRWRIPISIGLNLLYRFNYMPEQPSRYWGKMREQAAFIF